MFFNNDLKSETKMNVFMFQQQAVFISGFIVGFIIFFLSEYTGSFFESSVLPNKHSSKSEQYEAWRQNQNAGISKLNQDAYIYGVLYSKDSNKLKLEAEWLKSKVPITCVVFVEKLKLAAAIKDTWGKQCNQILFFSQHLIDVDLSVINLGIKFTSSWQLLCETINYLWERKNKISLKWVIFIKDDTFVIPENLRHMLAPLNFREPYYLGHAVILWGQPYNVAQAGYVLSYEVLRKLVNMFDTSKKCAAGGKYWKKEDYYLGKHLATLGIQPLDTRDLKQEGIFHGYPLNTLLWGVAKPGNYYTRALYPLGPECCSNKSITFNIGDPHKMRTFNYLLYHLRIFEGGIYGNRPAPTPIPENEVWRVALREEFNLTDLKDISSEQYFQIWRTKYSEPELFIAKNFKRKSGILKPVLEVYDTESEIRNESP